jgi:hypothetical protein
LSVSNFSVPVVRIRAIEPIPNADAIELAVIGDYRSVVRKGQFRPGDMAVYLPEAALLPDALIETLGLTGKLAGSAHNRIKAIRLRGCLSQGILYGAVPDGAAEGSDVAAMLGIVKYEPPIPSHMAGEVADVSGHPLKYDIENFKAFPDILQDGEPVEMTEKTHGTFCGIAVVPNLFHAEMFGGDGLVYSKGLGGKGLAFKDCPAMRRMSMSRRPVRPVCTTRFGVSSPAGRFTSWARSTASACRTCPMAARTRALPPSTSFSTAGSWTATPLPRRLRPWASPACRCSITDRSHER